MTRPSPATAYVEQVIQSWREKGDPSAIVAVRARPDLQLDDNHVLDLVYEEFCLRSDQGEPVSVETFVKDFPTLRDSICDMLDVHDGIEGDSIASESLGSVEWPEVGDSFGDYEIVGELGQGAMSHVYLARNPEIGPRFVALKVSHDTREAATAGSLDHDHIMNVLWVEKDPDHNRTWMCMPYFGSATLRDLLRLAFYEQQTPPRQAMLILEAAQRNSDLEKASEQREVHATMESGAYIEGVLLLIRQLADALHHAHQRGVYHRDLKPSNVLLTTSGSPKLFDFNLSIDRNIAADRAGGTLGYMAPEQIADVFGLGPRSELDARSEVYALAVIGYELLTGRMPFGRPRQKQPRKTAWDMLRRQTTWRALPPSHFNAAIPPQVDQLILQCLECEPELRIATAGDLAEAVAERQAAVELQRVDPHRYERWGAAVVSFLAVVLLIAGSIIAHQDAKGLSRAEASGKASHHARNTNYELSSNYFELLPRDSLSEEELSEYAFALLMGRDNVAAADVYSDLKTKYPKEASYFNNYGMCRVNAPITAYQNFFRAYHIDQNAPQPLRNLASIPFRCETFKIGLSEARLREHLGYIGECVRRDCEVPGIYMSGVYAARRLGDRELAFTFAKRCVELGNGESPFVKVRSFRNFFTAEQLDYLAKMEPNHEYRELRSNLIMAPPHWPAEMHVFE